MRTRFTTDPITYNLPTATLPDIYYVMSEKLIFNQDITQGRKIFLLAEHPAATVIEFHGNINKEVAIKANCSLKFYGDIDGKVKIKCLRTLEIYGTIHENISEISALNFITISHNNKIYYKVRGLISNTCDHSEHPTDAQFENSDCHMRIIEKQLRLKYNGSSFNITRYKEILVNSESMKQITSQILENNKFQKSIDSSNYPNSNRALNY